MSKEEIYEAIEDYLNGTLVGNDLKNFEARLQSDTELVAQVELFREMDDAIGDKEVLNFQEMVQAEGVVFLENSSPEEKTQTPNIAKRINLARRYFLVAASILFLITSALIYWNMQSGAMPTGSELFAQYHEVYDLNQNVRGIDASTDPKFQSGLQQYQAKNYSAAANIFQELATSNETDMVLAFSLGSAYLNQQTPNLNLASQQFEKIMTDGQSIYVPRAKWYQAMIHLKEENLEKAKPLLEDLAKSKDSFGEKASKILEKI